MGIFRGGYEILPFVKIWAQGRNKNVNCMGGRGEYSYIRIVPGEFPQNQIQIHQVQQKYVGQNILITN